MRSSEYESTSREQSLLMGQSMLLEAIGRVVPTVLLDLKARVLPVFRVPYGELGPPQSGVDRLERLHASYPQAQVVAVSRQDLGSWECVGTADEVHYPELQGLREELQRWSRRWNLADT